MKRQQRYSDRGYSTKARRYGKKERVYIQKIILLTEDFLSHMDDIYEVSFIIKYRRTTLS